jgi:hypothetical protein
MKRSPLAAAVVGTAALALLTSCSLLPKPAPDLPDPPTVGACLSDRAGKVVDRTAVVPCSDEHLFEVTGVVTWDGMDAAIKADDAAAVYKNLVSGENVDFESAMIDACDAFKRQILGVDGVLVNGVDAASMDLTVLGPLLDYSLNDRDSFIAGDHTTICVTSWTGFDDEERSVAYPEGIGLEDYASPDFPTDLHVCATSVDDKNTFLDCAEPHEAQQLLSFNGVDAVGADWIATVTPGDLVVADYDVPDAVCADLIAQAFPGLPEPGWQVWSNLFGGSAGWQAFDGTVDPDGSYYFSCELVAPSNEQAILGDAFSGSATIVSR